jgi:hypothetical protein
VGHDTATFATGPAYGNVEPDVVSMGSKGERGVETVDRIRAGRGAGKGLVVKPRVVIQLSGFRFIGSFLDPSPMFILAKSTINASKSAEGRRSTDFAG